MAPRITCICGSCQKCKHREYMRQWYRRPENTERHRATARQSRARRLAYVQEYDRARGFRVYDEEKKRARNAVTKALRDGRLQREPCEVCGAAGEAHHEDYAKPLDVRWYCRRHHLQRHQRVNPQIESASA